MFEYRKNGEDNVDHKNYVFEQMPEHKALLTLAVPTVISQLISLVYNMVDIYFVGRTGNSYMMAAVTLTSTLYIANVALSNLFGIGGGSLISRLIGKKEYERAKSVSSFSAWGALVLAIAYSAIVLFFLDPLLHLLGASSGTYEYAKQYVILVVVIGNLPSILSITLAHLLRNAGYSKQASIGLSGGGILNMILDPIFMFVLMPDGMEVTGAALATMLSNVVACGYLLIIFIRVAKDSSLSFDIKKAGIIRKDDRKELFSVGIPSAVLTGLFDVSYMVLNANMAGHGDLQLAAIGIVMRIERLPNALNIGLCQGMLPLVAYNYSADNRARMKKTITVTRIIGLSISAISILLFELMPGPICRLFMNTTGANVSDSLQTITFATTFLSIRCLASPFQFFNYNTSFCMQAIGDGKGTLIHAIVRELVLNIPFMFLFNAVFGQVGLASALIVAEVFGAYLAYIFYKMRVDREDSNSTCL